MYTAWMRDGDAIQTGEALLLACMFKAKGTNKEDLIELQRIMKDKNYEPVRDGGKHGKV